MKNGMDGMEMMPQGKTNESNGKQTFYCPHCGEKLSILDGTIVKLNGELKNGKFSVRTPVYLPARLGHYGAIIAGEIKLSEGAKVEFYCPNPNCNANFTSGYNDDLAELRMVDGNGKDFIVVFNKIFGHQSTFLLDSRESQLVSVYGDHAGQYRDAFSRRLNFFGAV